MPSLLLAGEQPFPDSGWSAWDMIRILLVLGLVVALILFVLRFIGKRNRGWWMNRSLRSLGGLAVGANKSMQIVEWNGRIYVLGVGENVTLLEAITDPEQVAALLAEHDSANAVPDNSVGAWLQRLKQRGQPSASNDGGSGESEGPSMSFEQTLENRLRQMSERREKVGQLLDRSRSEDRTDEP
ncbi:flagellar biosynthetic protein FliO [Cohnella zeiphila]|uniref:Flagellar biosynthetic protein FliO n=1 Tax=Cohnella zeiphila TaxID=2761120 RepID=A0A7X0VWX4_9BACL|nr:flagellar biosynthetic protein FliO [Cohnella zeiphila]MBB6732862.1 flagellar biosynthetic protein FliO [Cohnella zeiphila]